MKKSERIRNIYIFLSILPTSFIVGYILALMFNNRTVKANFFENILIVFFAVIVFLVIFVFFFFILQGIDLLNYSKEKQKEEKKENLLNVIHMLGYEMHQVEFIVPIDSNDKKILETIAIYYNPTYYALLIDNKVHIFVKDDDIVIYKTTVSPKYFLKRFIIK